MAERTKIAGKQFIKQNLFMIVLIICTAVLITVAGVYYKQSFLLIWPLYNSLIVLLLHSRVNRYGSLMGSLNSLLYTVVYFHYHLYGSALSALLVSFPMQMLTFIRWNRNKWKQATVLRRMDTKQRLLTLLVYAVSLAVMSVVMPLLGAEYAFIDSASSLLGVFTQVMTMLAFVEYSVCMFIGCGLSIVLYITMIVDQPETATYLIYSVYSLICTFFTTVRARKMYSEQQQNAQD